MTANTALRVVSTEQRISERDKVRQQMKDRIAALKPGSKERLTSERLLDVLEVLLERPNDESAQAAALKVVGERIERLKRMGHHLDAVQRRDLKLILYFTSTGTVLRDAREDAVALLKLWGDDASIAEVCKVYPGLRRVFEE